MAHLITQFGVDCILGKLLTSIHPLGHQLHGCDIGSDYKIKIGAWLYGHGHVHAHFDLKYKISKMTHIQLIPQKIEVGDGFVFLDFFPLHKSYFTSILTYT